MKSFIRKSIRFIYNIVYTIYYIIKLLFICRKIEKVEKTNFETLYVLANGPSLDSSINDIIQNRIYEDTSNAFAMMNFSANDERFYTIKPKFYFLQDPMFYKKGHNEKKVHELYKVMNEKITWPIIIYTTLNHRDELKAFSHFTNENISIKALNNLPYKGFSSWNHILYSHNWAMIPIKTVVHTIIFWGINSQFKEIRLYGVDHNFFDRIIVGKDNKLYCKKDHYYDKEDEIKPVMNNVTNSQYRLYDYLIQHVIIFKIHDMLAEYARYRGFKILNCTKNSLIDSYERG